MCKQIDFDDYEIITHDYEVMMKEIRKMAQATEWKIIPKTSDVRATGFFPMDIVEAEGITQGSLMDSSVSEAALMLASVLTGAADPQLTRELLAETADREGTKLMVSFENENSMVRPCAIASIYQSAKISGSALGRLMAADPKGLADILNRCFTVARGSALALFRAGKCSAIHSDNYVIMNTQDIVQIAELKLKARFGKLQFVEGYNSHNYTSLMYLLPDKQDELLKKYQEAMLGSHSLRGINFIPAVRVSTSDTGYSAATITPYFMTKSGTYLTFVKPIKVPHRNYNGHAAGLEKFEEHASMVFSKFEETAEIIAKMGKHTMYHPINAIVNFGKKIDLPKKYVEKAVAAHQMLGDAQCCMHDVYLSLYDGIAEVENPMKRLELEELISRVLTLEWSDYDTAIVM